MDISRVNNLFVNQGDYKIGTGVKEEPMQISTNDSFGHAEVPNLDLRAQVEKLQAKRTEVTKPVQTVQYADSRGRVEHLAIMLSGMYRGEAREQILGAYKTMFLNMEPDTKFTLCVESEKDQKDVENMMKKAKVPNQDRIKFIYPNKHGLTIWARDMLVSSYDADSGKSYMINTGHIHSRDGDIPPFISKNTDVGVVNTPTLVTDGGDTVATPTHSFVGFDSISRTRNNLENLANNYPEFNNWAVNYYKNVMGKEPESGTNLFKTVGPEAPKVDTSNMPETFIDNQSELTASNAPVLEKWAEDHHLIKGKDDGVENPGLFKTLGWGGSDDNPRTKMFEDLAVRLFEDYFGKEVVPVGKDDPSTPEVEKPAVFHQDMCITPVKDDTFFLADPTLFEDLVNGMTPAEYKKANEQMSKVCGFNVDLKDYIESGRRHNTPADFESYNKILQDKGYDVVRIPYQFSYTTSAPSFTYNNCLMERFEKDGEQVQRVFLPIIGVDFFDNIAIKAYEDQGYEVQPIPMGHVCKLQGELRCITNWLERSEKV